MLRSGLKIKACIQGFTIYEYIMYNIYYKLYITLCISLYSNFEITNNNDQIFL